MPTSPKLPRDTSYRDKVNDGNKAPNIFCEINSSANMGKLSNVSVSFY